MRRFLGRAGVESGPEDRGRVFHGDLDHMHHRMLRAGLSHRAAATWLYAFSIFLLSVGLLSMMYRSHALGIYIVAFLMGTYVTVRHLAQVELWDSGRAIVSGLKRPPGKFLAATLYMPFDLLAMAAALALAMHFTDPGQAALGLRRFWFDRLPFWVGIPFLALFAIRTYQRVWTRAHVSEYLLLGVAVMAGALFAAGMDSVLTEVSTRDLLIHLIAYAGVAIPLITGVRIMPAAVVDGMNWVRHRQSPADAPNHTLVYGAGHPCALFLREANLAAIENRGQFDVVGLVDEDSNLHGCYVYGVRVFGGLEQISELIKAHHIESIVITEPIGSTLRGSLLSTAQAHGVGVTELRTVMSVVSEPGARGPCPPA